MRHLRCIVNFGYHLPAKEIIFWRKQLLKVKILEFGHKIGCESCIRKAILKN